MAANILNSPRAVAMSVYVIRAFVETRKELAANATILKRLAEFDKTLLVHPRSAMDKQARQKPSSDQFERARALRRRGSTA